MRNVLVAADMLNDRVIPFYESVSIPVLRILTDRGTEFCGSAETHEYQLFLALNDIDHTRTKARSPQTNGICERFQKTLLTEFYRVALRKKIYRSLEKLQVDLDEWLWNYNEERTHEGNICNGKTSMQTLLEGKQVVLEKVVNF
jgi:transposase InsO family protein